MATAINYAKEYGRELAQAYPYQLQFGSLWANPNTKRYKLDTMKANGIYIPSVTVTEGMSDGDRDTIGTFTRKHSNDWEYKELKNHKTWNTLVHPMDVVQSNAVATIANATREYNITYKFPYLDKMLLTAVYNDSKTVLENANVTEETLTADNVLTVFDNLMDVMDDAFVPTFGRILYVPTKVKTLIDNCKDVYRISGTKVLGRAISRIDEVEVIGVPTSVMQTEDKQDILMFLVHPSLILPVCTYEFSGIEAPSVHSQGKALYFEEFFCDAFILNKKAVAAQFVIPKNTTPSEPSTGN